MGSGFYSSITFTLPPSLDYITLVNNRVNEEEGVKLTEESGKGTSMILNCECFDIFFIRIFEGQ